MFFLVSKIMVISSMLSFTLLQLKSLLLNVLGLFFVGGGVQKCLE